MEGGYHRLSHYAKAESGSSAPKDVRSIPRIYPAGKPTNTEKMVSGIPTAHPLPWRRRRRPRKTSAEYGKKKRPSLV